MEKEIHKNAEMSEITENKVEISYLLLKNKNGNISKIFK